MILEGSPGLRGLRLGAWEMGIKLSQNNEDGARDVKSGSNESRERDRETQRQNCSKYVRPDEPAAASAGRPQTPVSSSGL